MSWFCSFIATDLNLVLEKKRSHLIISLFISSCSWWDVADGKWPCLFMAVGRTCCLKGCVQPVLLACVTYDSMWYGVRRKLLRKRHLAKTAIGEKKVFPVCKLLFSSLCGYIYIYIFEPVCLVVCLTFSWAFCTSILNLEHLNLCLNNTFAEAMLHGENPWPDLGRKAWTSPWWITWAWPSWETNHVNHSVSLLSWVLILHSCPVVKLVTCVHSLQCILKHLGSSCGVFGSTFGPFWAICCYEVPPQYRVPPCGDGITCWDFDCTWL